MNDTVESDLQELQQHIAGLPEADQAFINTYAAIFRHMLKLDDRGIIALALVGAEVSEAQPT